MMKADKLIIGVVFALAACGQESEAPALGSAQQLMAQEMQPAADVFWQSVRFESELMPDGTVEERDIQPTTDEEWEEVRASAARMGELGQEMLQPAYAEGRGEDWTAYAEGLVIFAGQAEEIAVARDTDGVFEVGGSIYNVCRACHQSYPPADLPEGVTVEDIATDRPNDEQSLEEYVDQPDD